MAAAHAASSTSPPPYTGHFYDHDVLLLAGSATWMIKVSFDIIMPGREGTASQLSLQLFLCFLGWPHVSLVRSPYGLVQKVPTRTTKCHSRGQGVQPLRTRRTGPLTNLDIFNITINILDIFLYITININIYYY